GGPHQSRQRTDPGGRGHRGGEGRSAEGTRAPAARDVGVAADQEAPGPDGAGGFGPVHGAIRLPPERSQSMRRYRLIILCLLLLAPAALGQQGPRSGTSGADSRARDAAKARAMYEDIEIMRRLMIRSLTTRSAVFKLAQCTTCHMANTAFFDV